MNKGAVASVAAAAVIAVGAAGVEVTRSLMATDFVVPPTPTLENFGVKFTLKGCAQRIAASTRIGGKGVLYVAGDADWWFNKVETVKTNVAGADIIPPFLTGYMPPGTWQGQAYADTGGGTFRVYWSSRKCPAATEGMYIGDASITTVTVLPRIP